MQTNLPRLPTANRRRGNRPSEPRAFRRNLVGLLCWLAVSFAAAAVGAVASAEAGLFYAQLSRPAWAPPGWLFGPVWSVLYVLMGLAAWVVWQRTGLSGGKSPLLLFLLQLSTNAIWPWVFFVFRRGVLAFAEVLVLWALVFATMFAFWRVRRLAAVLLVPYLAWVTFAAALTFFMWQRNPGLLG